MPTNNLQKKDEYNARRISIKNWQEEDRPREKLMMNGSRSMSVADLLAILIGSGTTKLSAVEIAKKVLDRCGHNLTQLFEMGMAELQEVEGIGPARAVVLKAALELASRKPQITHKHKIMCSIDIYDYLSDRLCYLDHEELWVLLMDNAHNVIMPYLCSTGGLSSTTFDVRKVMRKALQEKAAYMALAHNHPSGSIKPSAQDIDVTRKLKKAGQFFDITLNDHIIVGSGNDYFSFADKDMIKSL